MSALLTPVHWLVQTAPEVPSGDAWLGPGERSALASLRFAKRRQDWILGRWTAKSAVLARQATSVSPPPWSSVEILSAEDGAPEPYLDGTSLDLVLSLSHRDGLAAAAVGPAGAALGCDVELIEEHTPHFVLDYFTAAERAIVEAATPDRHAHLATLIWSAKESALKALRKGLTLDTRAVEVEARLSGPDRQGWRPLRVRHAAGNRTFVGWWRDHDRHVLTLVASPAAELPVLLRPLVL